MNGCSVVVFEWGTVWQADSLALVARAHILFISVRDRYTCMSRPHQQNKTN